MKALLRSGLLAALGLLASHAGAQEPAWKGSASNGSGPAITLSQPTPLTGAAPAPAPTPAFRIISGSPAATVRAQAADDRMFQIEPLLQPGETKPPQQLPKDSGFVPPPPAPVTSGPAIQSYGGGGCDSGCGACDACNICGPASPRLGIIHGWGPSDPSERQFWVSAEALMWWQRGQGTPPLVVSNPGGTPLAQTGILGNSAVLYDHTPNYTEGGGRFGAGMWFQHFDNNLGFEVGYFFLARQDSTANFDSAGDPSLSRPFVDSRGFLNAEPFAINNPGANVATGSAIIHDYTQLWGMDANFRYKLYQGPNCWLDLLAGYRYLNLSEGISILEDRNTSIVGGIPLSVHTREAESWDTRNEFSGAQIGLTGECRLWEKWSLGFDAKVAFGSTYEVVNINGSTTYQFPAGLTQFNGTQQGALLASPTNIGTHSRNQFAVAPEVGVHLGYDITDHIRIFGGYNFLYLSSVMRPGDQIDLQVNQAYRPVNGTTPGFGNSQSPAVAGPRVPGVPLQTTGYWAQGLTFGLMYRY